MGVRSVRRGDEKGASGLGVGGNRHLEVGHESPLLVTHSGERGLVQAQQLGDRALLAKARRVDARAAHQVECCNQLGQEKLADQQVE